MRDTAQQLKPVPSHRPSFTIISRAASILLVLAGVSVFLLQERIYNRAISETDQLQRQVYSLNNAIVSEVLSARSYLIAGEEEDITSRSLAHQEILSWLAMIESKLPAGSNQAVRLQDIASLHSQYDALTTQLIDLHQTGASDKANQLFDSRSDPLVSSLISKGQLLQEDVQTTYLEAGHNLTNGIDVSIGLFALAAVITIANKGIDIRSRPTSAAFKPSSIRPLSAQILFVDRLAHDMNALLAAIIGYAGLMSEADLYSDVASYQTFGKIITRQALRLEKMITDARLATRIVENRIDLTLTFVHIHPLLAALTAEIGRQNDRTVTYTSSLGNAAILGDSLRLREAFTRVIDNAIKFSPEGTPVSVSLSLSAQTGWVEIRVQDQGIGIEPSEMPKLFQAFGRAAGDEARHAQGPGLGLFIARSVFSAHQGDIQLESTPGHGTCAVIRLPLAEAES